MTEKSGRKDKKIGRRNKKVGQMDKKVEQEAERGFGKLEIG